MTPDLFASLETSDLSRQRARIIHDARSASAASTDTDRAALVGDFLELLYARASVADLGRRPASELAAYAAGLFELADSLRSPQCARVRSVRGDSGSASVFLETVCRDQPFIVDSLRELVRVRDYEMVSLLHPVLSIERGADGRLTRVGPARDGGELLSVVSLEIAESLSERAREKLEREAGEVLEAARAVVGDFDTMLARLHEAIRRTEERSAAVDGPQREGLAEAVAFLGWLEQSNFVFLGCRTYRFVHADSGTLVQMEAGSGLGILEPAHRSAFERRRPLDDLSPGIRERVEDPATVVIVQKTKAESPVLRRTRMDSVGVKLFDDAGRLEEEVRFVGLLTAKAHNDLPSDIPLLRTKLQRIFELGDVKRGSHDYSRIFSIFTSLPKSELFAMPAEEIAERVFALLESSGTRNIRVLYREDLFERGVSVLVLVPRDRLSAAVQARVKELVEREFDCTCVDSSVALTDEPLARLHFYLESEAAQRAEVSIERLQSGVRELTRTWDELLRASLVERMGLARGVSLARRYGAAFPAAYIAGRSAADAVEDVVEVDVVVVTGTARVAVRCGRGTPAEPASQLVVKVFHPARPLGLSELMPILTHLGFDVLDEETFRVAPRTTELVDDESVSEVHLHTFRVVPADDPAGVAATHSARIAESISRVLSGASEDDPMNALVARAGLSAREVAVLRAYYAYLRQLGAPWRQRTVYTTLLEHHAFARGLIDLFEARFDPGLPERAREERQETARTALAGLLERVQSIAEDQVLRAFENAVTSTVRTSYFTEVAQERGAALALKIDCAGVLAMPEPRPAVEIFVSSPTVEGVHLRSGKVARGGIRWSSRPDDYRTEILGLMKAQRTKNAVIVPVGAKGGFVIKTHRRSSAAAPAPDDVRRAYETYIGALLDVTDNFAGGSVVSPSGVVVHDGDDPYLVVAADRGTATFSDVANALALARDFWLGDAFASGGSTGYDHKKEGITARGAWECVRRHFHELGVDVDRDTFTVCGIGDMSGDVFGNGMLLSPGIRLVAAFNHLHIFLDPSPDPAVSFAERERLFRLPRSAWTDYDRAKISAGGGVYRRDSRSIPLSKEARACLGVDSLELNGEELVRAILRAPVDLLWNGGIGTYVKASSETHHAVGDPANDAVRLDGHELRTRVVGEGGNLGFTQLGRIEYARGGGKLNTDFIDNSAGVDTSDHEVNLKIYLQPSVQEGTLAVAERNEVLASVTDSVCAGVLRHNALQSLGLSLEERRGAAFLDEHRLLVEELSAAGVLQRDVEKLPDEREFMRLRAARAPLTRPQLAVLQAFAKIDAYAEILASDLPDSEDLDTFVTAYFPVEFVERFPAGTRAHRLRREIAATEAVNAVVNRMGVTFFRRLSRVHGEPFAGLLHALLVAWELAGATAGYAEADRLDRAGTAVEQLYAAYNRFAAAIEAAVAAVLRRRPAGRSIREVVTTLAAKRALVHSDPHGKDRGDDADASAAGGADEVPAGLRKALLDAERLAEDLDLADLLAASGQPLARVRRAWELAADALLLPRIVEEGGRIACATAEDLQARASLLEEASGLRRAFALRLLGDGDRDAAAAAAARPAAALEESFDEAAALARLSAGRELDRARVSTILAAARSHEPLTLSGLFVIVEALRRVTDG